MRCPKCSYITFDHGAICPKCRHNLSELAGQLHGTSIKAEGPNFLGPALQALTAKALTEEDGGEAIRFPGPVVEEATNADDVPDLDLALDQADETVGDIPILEAVTAEQPDLDLQGVLVEEATEADSRQATDEVLETPETAAKEPAEVAMEETGESEAPAGPVTLQFEGLDLSDLSPESSGEGEAASPDEGEEEGEVFDMWSFDDNPDAEEKDASTGDDLFEDLLFPG